MLLNVHEQNPLLLVAEPKDQNVIVICTADAHVKQVPVDETWRITLAPPLLFSRFQAHMRHTYLPQQLTLHL